MMLRVALSALGAVLLIGCTNAAVVFATAEEALAAANMNLNEEGHQFFSQAATVRRVLEGYKCTSAPDEPVCHALGPGAFLPRHDPFLEVDYITMKAGDEQKHALRGHEEVTMILRGAMDIEDTAGHQFTARIGDVHWVNAGSGVYQTTKVVQDGYAVKLSINLPRDSELSAPRQQLIPNRDMQHVQLTAHRGRGSLDLIAGELLGSVGPALNSTEVTIAIVEVDRRSHVHIPIPLHVEGFIFGLQGHGHFGGDRELRDEEINSFDSRATVLHHPGRTMDAMHLARLQPAKTTQVLEKERVDDLTVTTEEEPLTFLLVHGVPTSEPVFRQGGLVLSSKMELKRAVDEHSRGKLVQEPSHTDL